MTFALGSHQEGDNCNNVTTAIANGDTATPSVALHPERIADGNYDDAMQSFSDAEGRTPEFTLPIATFAYGDFQGNFRVCNPYYSYNGIDWTLFDNADAGADGLSDLVFSNNTPFTGSTVQIAMQDPYTWVRLWDLVANTWKRHPWVGPTLSADSDLMLTSASVPADTDSLGRTHPAQDRAGFRIAHPDFLGTRRRNAVLNLTTHTQEHIGANVGVQFVNLLLNASPSGDVYQQQAYTFLKYFDVFVYPHIVPNWYTGQDTYQGSIAANYNFGSNWDSPNATIHTPLINAVEADIDSTAEVVIDFHGMNAYKLIGLFYQVTSNADPNGDDPDWFALYGTNKYWYYEYLEEIVSNNERASSNNAGAIREYGRVNWGASIGVTIEGGQYMTHTAAETKENGLAVLNMCNRLVGWGRTSLPATYTPQFIG